MVEHPRHRVHGTLAPLQLERALAQLDGERRVGELEVLRAFPGESQAPGVRGEQALIYRLSGDRNPLHVDPKFAARGGFSQPILHGLCTYGVTGRALLHALCGSDPARFRSMSGRFSRPVLPGESLTVSMWRQRGSDTAAFQTTGEDGAVVIDRGLFQGG